MRLVIPSLATPIGGLVSGIIMSRWGYLSALVRIGSLTMVLGNGLVASLKFRDVPWKYLVYLVPANFGQGMVYPAILFTNLAAFDHSRECLFLDSVTTILTKSRASGFYFHGVSFSINGYCLGSGCIVDVGTKHLDNAASNKVRRNSKQRRGRKTSVVICCIHTNAGSDHR